MAKTKTYRGLKLFPWQKAVTDEICIKPGTSRIVTVKAPRQLGKSAMSQQVLLWYAINLPRTKNAMISPTLNQARKVFKELVDGIIDSGIVKRKNETLLEIELINGSTIFFKSAEMRDALRGYTVTGILIWDEAAYLLPEIAEYTLPWLQVSKANLLIVSTPRVRSGLFYEYWSRGLEGDNVVAIDWNEFDTSDILTETLKKEYRKVLTRNQYRSEIEGEFLDQDGMVFSNIEDCATATVYNPDHDHGDMYIGIDFGSGGGNDFTSISVFDDAGEMKYLRYFNDLSTFQQVDTIAAILEQFNYQIKSINAENNSIGNALIDLIIKRLNDDGYRYIVNKINRWITSNQSKAELVSQFSVGLERYKAKILNDSVLINQLGAFEATYNPKTQVITYNGAAGTHDDTVMSTMLAWRAYLDGHEEGQYCIGFK